MVKLRTDVFIGSTQKDLADYRNAARDAILAMDYHPLMMEYWPAQDSEAVKACREKVSQADIYVGLFAHRYGHCPEGSDISITEIEFNEATTQEIPRLCFFLDDAVSWPVEYVEGEPGKTKLADFKKRISKAVTRVDFSSPVELEARVYHALSKVKLRRRQVIIGNLCLDDVSHPVPTTAGKSKIHLIFEGDIEEFNKNRDTYLKPVADKLGITTGMINILTIFDGSVHLLVEMPEKAAQQLDGMASGNPAPIETPIITQPVISSTESKVVVDIVDQANDPALQAAWERLMDYDQVSTAQKMAYQNNRSQIIALGLVTTSLAVFTNYVSVVLLLLLLPVVTVGIFVFNAGYHLFKTRKITAPTVRKYIPLILSTVVIPLVILLINNGVSIAPLSRVLLIILPLITIGLLSYGKEFAASTTWIEYRVSAEWIRSNIYLFRAGAGRYRDLSIPAQRKTLLDAVQEADQRIPLDNRLPFLQGNSNSPINKRISERAKSSTNDRDLSGMDPISVEQYIDYRLNTQVDWYITRIKQDRQIMRNNRIAALIIAGSGAALAGLNMNLEPLIAITIASGVAIESASALRMYGRTYDIYHLTALQLSDLKNHWLALFPQERTRDKQLGFIEAAEKVFTDEQKKWSELSIQIQTRSEENLAKGLQMSPTAGRLEVSTRTISDDETTEEAGHPLVVEASGYKTGSVG